MQLALDELLKRKQKKNQLMNRNLDLLALLPLVFHQFPRVVYQRYWPRLLWHGALCSPHHAFVARVLTEAFVLMYSATPSTCS